jgi:hypothetical protein
LEMSLFSLMWNYRVAQGLVVSDDEDGRCPSSSETVARNSADTAGAILRLILGSEDETDGRGPVDRDQLRVLNGKKFARIQTFDDLRAKGYVRCAAPGSALSPEEAHAVEAGIQRCVLCSSRIH